MKDAPPARLIAAPPSRLSICQAQQCRVVRRIEVEAMPAEHTCITLRLVVGGLGP